MANEVTVEGRYMKYNKADVERLLDQVENTRTATGANVRDIVRNWGKNDHEPEPTPEPEPELETATEPAEEPEPTPEPGE